MQMRLLMMVLVSFIAVPVHAAVIDVAVTDDLRALLAAAQPGDEFVLAAGTYELGGVRAAISVTGTSDAPVVVRSGSSGRAVLSRATSAQDVLVIENSSYVVLRGLELSGGDRGVDIIGSDQIVIEQCLIHGGATGGVAAATGNGTVAQNQYIGIWVRDNDIYDVGGAAVRLGCDDPFICATREARVERNEIYGVGATGVVGGGIRVGAGSIGTIVRNNVIHDGAGPAVSVLGDATGVSIEGNGIWDVSGVGIEVTRGAAVRNNVIFGSSDFTLRTVASGASVGALRLVNNTLIGASGIDVGQPQSDIVIANNAIYAGGTAIAVSGNATAATFVTNFGTGTLSGVSDVLGNGGTVNSAFVNAASLNAHLTANSPLIGVGTASYQPGDDFDGRPRGSSADVGAYAFVDGDEDDDDGGLPGGGSPDPGVGSGGGAGGGAAKSLQEDCSAAPGAWPAVLAVALLMSRRRRVLCASSDSRLFD